MPKTLKFSDRDIVIADVNIEPLLRRGLSHFLGNEQASRASTKAAKWSKDNAKDGVEPAPTDDQKTAWKSECVAEAIERLAHGELGTSLRGPAVDPFEAMCDRVTLEQVKLVLKANDIALPKGDEAVKFPNGSTKTLDEMVASRRANPAHSSAIEAEARKRIKAKESETKKRAAKMAELKAEGGDAEAMGL